MLKEIVVHRLIEWLLNQYAATLRSQTDVYVFCGGWPLQYDSAE